MNSFTFEYLSYLFDEEEEDKNRHYNYEIERKKYKVKKVVNSNEHEAHSRIDKRLQKKREFYVCIEYVIKPILCE